jgi:hypothetical protein
LRDTDLRALRDKYERMLRLRQLHDRAQNEADFVEPDPREEMASLARAFPGALREIDELPIEVIRTRIDELANAERDSASVASWMKVHARFHALARGALAAKRWLEGRVLTPALDAEFASAIATGPIAAEAEEATEWIGHLAEVAKPPRGRVMDLVYARLAKELDVDVATARAAVSGRAAAAAAAAARRARGPT